MKIRLTMIICCALVTLGCANIKRNPVPQDQIMQAQVLNTEGIRTFGGEFDQNFQEDLKLSVTQQLEYNAENPDYKIDNSVLLISGGGSYGSYGAGFLNGWSSAGTRPDFKVVTGISTGALIAPVAFVGSKYDNVLKELYTGVSTDDVAKARGIATLWSDSLADPSPLMEILETYITESFIKEVAQAHNEGRRLYLGTTNLDAQRLVIWNMGLLANIDDPRVPDLFRRLMIASSSIPIVFPPVMIEVESKGEPYDEMHVDGGVITQVFFHMAIVDIQDIKEEFPEEVKRAEKGKIYIIRNGTVLPVADQIDRSFMDITARSLSTVLKSSAMNDLRRIHFLAQKEGLDFYYTGIPEDFEFTSTEAFDRLEMIDLYYLGYQIGSSPDRWQKEVPGDLK